nr:MULTISPECIES: alpha/beta hydrolase [Mesorhizobium]
MSLKSLCLGAAALAVVFGAPPAFAQPTQNVILVHGALVDGSGWRGVYERLVAKGLKVTVVQEPNTSLADDVQAVHRAIEQQNGPVVLVGHSYGGQIITEAGVDPKVSALVYVAAIVPDVGEGVGDVFEKWPSPTADAFKPTSDGFLLFDPAKFRAGFAADLSKAETDFMTNSQVPVSAKILGTKTQHAAWKTKRATASWPGWTWLSAPRRSGLCTSGQVRRSPRCPVPAMRFTSRIRAKSPMS